MLCFPWADATTKSVTDFLAVCIDDPFLIAGFLEVIAETEGAIVNLSWNEAKPIEQPLDELFLQLLHSHTPFRRYIATLSSYN